VTINSGLAKLLGTYLAGTYDADSKAIECCIKGLKFDAWGKMQQIGNSEGLDMITGYVFMLDVETQGRDTTFVKVFLSFTYPLTPTTLTVTLQYISEWDHLVHGHPKYDPKGTFTFGHVEYFLILGGDVIKQLVGLKDDQDAMDTDTMDMDKEHELTKTLALAIISPIPSFRWLRDCNMITYRLARSQLGPAEVVDIEDVMSLVGHMQDHTGHCYVVDRTSTVGKIDFANSLPTPSKVMYIYDCLQV
jgi:hypothetical protein